MKKQKGKNERNIELNFEEFQKSFKTINENEIKRIFEGFKNPSVINQRGIEICEELKNLSLNSENRPATQLWDFAFTSDASSFLLGPLMQITDLTETSLPVDAISERRTLSDSDSNIVRWKAGLCSDNMLKFENKPTKPTKSKIICKKKKVKQRSNNKFLTCGRSKILQISKKI